MNVIGFENPYFHNLKQMWDIHKEYCGKVMQGTVLAGFRELVS